MNATAARIKQIIDHTPCVLILSTTCTPWIPEDTIVVSEIRPMLSPKHAPPAIAQVVRRRLPVSTQLGSTMFTNHRKIGAHAANVPHDVPVATDRIAVTQSPITAVVLAVTPRLSARLTTDAPTPVDMNALAIAYANIRMKSATVILLTLLVAAVIHCWNLMPSVKRAITTAAIAATGAATRASCPEIIKPARTITGMNLIIAFMIKLSPFKK